MNEWTSRAKWLIFFAWFLSLVAMVGSLFFSEVMGSEPCGLCWYQRIALYPLVLILPIAILEKKANIYAYVLPLSLSGLAISVYHNLLYYHVITDGIVICGEGVSCTTRYIEWFGFISIPLLALGGFALITASMLWLWWSQRKKTDDVTSCHAEL